jgi:hypothetical protein
MTTFEFISLEVAVLGGVITLAAMAVNGWVKVSHITDLEDKTEDKFKELKAEISSLWDKVSQIAVLGSKLESIEKSVTRIEEAVNRSGR